LLEGVQRLLDPSAPVKVVGKSGISQARNPLGVSRGSSAYPKFRFVGLLENGTALDELKNHLRDAPEHRIAADQNGHRSRRPRHAKPSRGAGVATAIVGV